MSIACILGTAVKPASIIMTALRSGKFDLLCRSVRVFVRYFFYDFRRVAWLLASVPTPTYLPDGSGTPAFRKAYVLPHSRMLTCLRLDGSSILYHGISIPISDARVHFNNKKCIVMPWYGCYCLHDGPGGGFFFKGSVADLFSLNFKGKGHFSVRGGF